MKYTFKMGGQKRDGGGQGRVRARYYATTNHSFLTTPLGCNADVSVHHDSLFKEFIWYTKSSWNRYEILKNGVPNFVNSEWWQILLWIVATNIVANFIYHLLMIRRLSVHVWWPDSSWRQWSAAKLGPALTAHPGMKNLASTSSVAMSTIVLR